MLEMLERMDKSVLEVPPKFTDLDEELFARAHKSLSYNAPVTSERADTARHTKNLSQLLQACDLVGCRYPFTNESVEKHKEAQQKKLNGSMLTDVLFMLAAIASAFALLASVVMSFTPISWSIVGMVAGISGAVLVICQVVGSKFNVEFPDVRRRYEWNTYSIERYSGPIPEFALQTACDLNESKALANGPHCYFGVEALEQRNLTATDPFLTVTISGKKYYLEVWNEPTYKQERMV